MWGWSAIFLFRLPQDLKWNSPNANELICVLRTLDKWSLSLGKAVFRSVLA